MQKPPGSPGSAMLSREVSVYSELKPIAPLSHVVECIWTSERSRNEVSSAEQRILPDGCADLIFDLTPGRESAYWVGIMTKSLVIQGSESTKMIGVRFNPGGARSLIGMPLAEVTNGHATVAEATPALSRATDSFLLEPSQIALQEWLLDVTRPDKTFVIIQRLNQMIKSAQCDIRISDVADQLGLSRQYLNRITNDYVGIDLKTLQRILRMRRLTECLANIPAPGSINWADVASAHAFYDQSHLIHDFKDIVGLLPTQFLK